MFKILIVEDDKELSLLFQKVLEKSGYQVKSASDGAQALEVLDREYIDLIISDIMMPVMDGYELVSELRSAGYQIPVLMITAKSSFDDMRQGFLSGSDDYMVKPVNVNENAVEFFFVLFELLEALFVTLGDVALLLDILFNVAAQHGITGKAAHIVYVLSYFKAGDLAHHIHIPHLQERAVKRRNSVKRKGEHGSKSHSTYGYRQDELSAQRK